MFTQEYISKNFLPKANNPQKKFKSLQEQKQDICHTYTSLLTHKETKKDIKFKGIAQYQQGFRMISHLSLFLLNKKPKLPHLFKTKTTGQGVMNQNYRED